MGDQRATGKWENGEYVEKRFDVDKYTLPTFELKIDSQSDITHQLGKIRATCKAQYTFGKFAKGVATITASTKDGISRPPYVGYEVSKQVQVDGKSFVEFDLKTELNIINPNADKRVRLTAVFIEELTKKERTAETSVTIHRYPFYVEIKRLVNNVFVPTFPFEITAVIKNWNGNTPVSDPAGLTYVTKFFTDTIRTCVDSNNQNYACREESFTSKTGSATLVNGISKFSVVSQAETTRMEIEVNYKGAKATMNIGRPEINPDQYIQIRQTTM